MGGKNDGTVAKNAKRPSDTKAVAILRESYTEASKEYQERVGKVQVDTQHLRCLQGITDRLTHIYDDVTGTFRALGATQSQMERVDEEFLVFGSAIYAEAIKSGKCATNVLYTYFDSNAGPIAKFRSAMDGLKAAYMAVPTRSAVHVARVNTDEMGFLSRHLNISYKSICVLIVVISLVAATKELLKKKWGV